MKLILLPNPKLREKSKNVQFPLSKDKINLIENMIKHIDDSIKPNSLDRPGVGIAAVQVGHLDKMYYISAPVSEEDSSPWKEFLINP
ncbi:MAG: peptide deformylase, partial [Mycoplasmataceae bacterium]|nr:peptide deformylase [Mycoplasmataceae bacterium]